jgi:sugar phosphate isomerase/epimerase
MAMQPNVLIPPELGQEAMRDYAAMFGHAKLIRALYGAGFGLIELGGDLPTFIPHAFSPQSVEALSDVAGELGIDYTVHLPLWSVEPSTPLQPIRAGSVRAMCDIIHAVAPLDPEVYVLHATGALAAEFTRMALPPAGKAMVLRQFQQAAMQSVRAVIEETGLSAHKLAIETVEFPFDLTMEIAEAVDVSVCLDVGHVLSGFSGTVDLLAVLDVCASRLAEVHLHDADLPSSPDQPIYGRDHRALGTGDLDVTSFLNHLTDLGFSGPVIFELTVEEAQSSLRLARGITG